MFAFVLMGVLGTVAIALVVAAVIIYRRHNRMRNALPLYEEAFRSGIIRVMMGFNPKS